MNESRNNGKKRNNKGRRNNKGYARQSETETKYSDGTQGKVSPTNDVSWYSTDPALLRDAASIPYSWATGSTSTLGNDLKWSNPGILALKTMPTFGINGDEYSALNTAAISNYSFIRHANSGHANYDAPDLMLYEMAISELYSYINWLQRLYGMASLYSQYNRYYPQALILANGVEFEDLLNNLASFRYGLNLLINQASSFAVQADMPIFKRRAFLYSGMYTDTMGAKGQIYMYVPAGFHRFVETDGPGHLVYVELGTDVKPSNNGLFTVKDLLNFGQSLIQPLLQSEDMGIMSGDILKAYGSNILKLASVPENYAIMPSIDGTVLEQMQNATVLDHTNVVTDGLSQDPTTGVIKSNVKYVNVVVDSTGNHELIATLPLTKDILSASRILATANAAPGPDTTMENTRLMVSFSDMTLDATEQEINVQTLKADHIYCGSEIVVGASCYTLFNGQLTHNEMSYVNKDIAMYTDASHFASALSDFSTFRFRPISMTLARRNGKYIFTGPMGQIDNYAIVDSETVQKLHDTAIMSMLHVSSIAKSSFTK